jgi:hypothetical protein
MVAVTLEYNNKSNVVLNGILDAVAKMPNVRMVRTIVPARKRVQSTRISVEDFSRLSLSEQAKTLSLSMNKNVAPMTMEEIVQEVRDYRNGK